MFNYKKINKFLKDNFPPYQNLEIIEETDTEIILLLDYGYHEEKLEITISRTLDNENLYRLESTIFRE